MKQTTNAMLSLQLPASFHSSSSLPPLDSSLGSSSSSHYSSSYAAAASADLEHEEGETRTARYALNGSIAALNLALRKSGVSVNSIDELWVLVDKEDYLTALQRAATYADCTSEEDAGTVHCLLLGSWNALCRLSSLQYKSAFRHYHSMRHYGHSSQQQQQQHHQLMTLDWHHSPFATMGAAVADPVDAALRAVNDAGELCCACQRELILARQREKRISQQQCSR